MNLVVELVIAAEHDEAAPGDGQGVEHLLSSLPPHLRVRDRLGTAPSLGDEESLDPLQGTVQGTTIGGDGNQENIGESGCEVDNLTAGLDSWNIERGSNTGWTGVSH